ncbi:beta-galactosidase [Patescibacteria group bacterium]|nr:beta-galactosidase [Patescibacteria group bacterium]
MNILRLIKRIVLLLFLIILFGGASIFLYLFVGSASQAETISWGVNFSQKRPGDLDLDWRETYIAILDDLGAQRLKIAVHWDTIEPEQDQFRFDDIDWQIQEAERRSAQILLVIGMKTPRWPECHIPEWLRGMEKKEQQQQILEMLETVVSRYKNSDAIWGWQVENEPFLEFGVCPWMIDEEFLRREVTLVKALDETRPVVISGSGEWSFWTKPVRVADIVGTTLYRKAWFSEYDRYLEYSYPPVYYSRKADIIRFIYDKKVIGVELQAEPWVPVALKDASLKEQSETMSLAKFQENIEYAKRTGFDEFYLWGAEWWYWMKVNYSDNPNAQIWNEAKKLFNVL